MIKAVIFDFDGVIVESVEIKTKAFAALFANEGKDVVAGVIDYHLKNSGVSRFEKFRYIYREILKRNLSEYEFQDLCDRFSQLVADAVVAAPFVTGAREFLEDCSGIYDFYIASATPLDELERIIEKKNISGYFKKIYGAPQRKRDIVRAILSANALRPEDALCIGDAISDYEAAKDNGVAFIARISADNNLLFKNVDCLQVKDLRNLRNIITRMTKLELNGKLKEAFDFFSSVTQKAYNSIYLLSNVVLSKNPSAGSFLNNFLKGEEVRHQNMIAVILNLSFYYLKSFIYFVIYMLFFAAFRLSGLRYSTHPSSKELVLIDVFFLVDRIKKNNKFEDPYFIGLREILDKMGKHYSYLPVFAATKNPLRLFEIFKIIRRDKEPVLTEYQLLSGIDLLRIFYFILVYPLSILFFIKRMTEDTYLSKLLKIELANSLRHVSFFNFSRYLQGRKIAGLPYKKIKIISWFENQSIDKNLYKGLREGENKIKIYGAQPFLFQGTELNVFADENEARFGIVPDKIIVNSTYFIPKSSTLHFIAGPSFRYRKIFTTKVDRSSCIDNILVLLPYYKEEAINILNLLSEMNTVDGRIVVKAHPVIPADKIKEHLPSGVKISDDDLYELFKTADIVIGTGSGALIESASVGVPVIYVRNINWVDYFPMPDYGKGIIWDEADSSGGIERLIIKFNTALKDANELDRIEKIADEYKAMFFCEPTDESIIKTYELD